MDRLRILRVINNNHLGLSLNDALLLADAIHAEFRTVPKPKAGKDIWGRVVAPVGTLRGDVQRVYLNEEVMAAINAGKKIQAIKELRVATGTGLKEAKDAVEWVERHGHWTITASPAPIPEK